MNKHLGQSSVPESNDALGDDTPQKRSRKPRGKRSPQRAEELALVERAKSGDHNAFRQLFERYHRRAYSLAYGVVRNPDDALDVVQDAFVKAHKHLGGFEGNSSFYTWLYRIVMNLSIDQVRRNKRVRSVDYDDAIEHDSGAMAGSELSPRILGQNPSKSLFRRQIRERIGEALERLSENHRAVLVMREFEGMSYEEMAEVMACSKGTIMSRLFHARKNMQGYLADLMDGDASAVEASDTSGGGD